MENRAKKVEELGRTLASAREECGVSQKYMAKALGKSIGTIQNWESGYSVPDLIDFIDWFDVLGLNPLRYSLDFLYPETYHDNDLKAKTDATRKALVKFIQDVMPDAEVRKMSFCMFANTGSSFSSQLDMMTAHNHTSLRSRVNIAQGILDNYQMEKARGELILTENIMPDEESLANAIRKAKESVFNRQNGYIK